MLRNVAKTAPYFHDGSVTTGWTARCASWRRVQLGRAMDDAAVVEIVSFLEALTGEVPPQLRPAARVTAMWSTPAEQRASNASGRTMHNTPGAAAADALVDPLPRRIRTEGN